MTLFTYTGLHYVILFFLQQQDCQIRDWRQSGERLLNNCVMQHHTGSAPGTMVRGGIDFHSRILLVRIAGTLNIQLYISQVLESVACRAHAFSAYMFSIIHLYYSHTAT